MAKESAVLAIAPPPELFPDEDDACRTAGMHLAAELGQYLEREGHTIPAWVRGGYPEDSWVLLESECRGVRYRFAIVFFPRGSDDRWMAIQGTADTHRPYHPSALREILGQFGAGYERSEVMSQAEFDTQY